MQQLEQQEGTTANKNMGAQDATNAISFLKDQHREVEDLFEQIESSSKRATKTKMRLFEELADKLTMHTKIEETEILQLLKDLEQGQEYTKKIVQMKTQFWLEFVSALISKD